MSLLERVERAQQPVADPTTAPPEPVAPAPAPAPTPERVAARDELLRQIRQKMQDEVQVVFTTLLDTKAEELRTKVEGIVDRVITTNGFAVTRAERMRLVEELIGEVGGLGPLEPLLADETVTEIMVNGPNHLYIERRGKILRVDTVFLNDEHVLRIIDRIITPLGRRIDQTSPRVDARLPDGSRVNAIIEPLSLIGPVITIRKFPAKPITVDDMIRFGTATPEMFDFLRACVEARLNVVRLGRDGFRQDDLPQRAVVVHPRRRADRHHRGCGRAAAPADARPHARGASGQPRGERRDHHPRPAAQRHAHAARPDHRR